MKKRTLWLLGGVAAGGYALYYYNRKKQAEAKKAAGLSGWFSDTPTEAAQKARDELVGLYEAYNAKVGTIPAELQVINPTRYNEAFAVTNRIYTENIGGGDTMMARGEIVRAKGYYDNGISELERLRFPEIDALLKSAPAAIAEYQQKMAAATTTAQQKAATESARVISQSETVRQARELQVGLEQQRELLAKIDVPFEQVEKGLKAIGAPLGIGGGKGFFENMSDFLTRMKWYALAAGGIYVAIKLGPTVYRWIAARQATRKLVPAVVQQNPRRRRASKRRK